MISIDAKPDAQSADMTLPGGCAVCGGDLVVRVAPGSSRGYCGTCRSLTRPAVRVVKGQLQVAHPMVGSA
ncbi:MAG: hypothetical protein L0Y66_19060 [Myxococcaceae bacterium]|nr:hypothetical protein [Myxococcaceae bacterium]MCI0672237.1 hypothetical protein [Myxococcaceae bacterium]